MKKIIYSISFLFLVFACTERNENKVGKSNIILFLVDDMGWQDTSVPFWDSITPFNDRYHTPNMERLAEQGMKFTQAYATPVCSPTRISLMTGMNAARHRVTNWTLYKNAMQGAEKNHKTLSFPRWNVNGICPHDSLELSVHADALPLLLQNEGYYTIHTGKAHFGAIGTPAENPNAIGFDVNIAGHSPGGPGSYLGKNNYSAAWRGGGNVWDVPGLEKYHGTDTFLTEALTLEAISYLDLATSNSQPFFLYMSHYAVHAPIEKDERFYQKYADMGLDDTEAKYAALLEGMDKSLGDLMDYLEEKQIEDNTIILFMSDNGGLSAVARGGIPHTHNKPLSSGKGSVHEGGIRVPMMAKWPGVVEPGSANNNYLIIEDFFPTILEMAGVKNANTVQVVDGQSFLPLLTNPKAQTNNRPLFWHYPNNWGPSGPGIGASSAIRLGDWKMIYYHSDESFELFNLAMDIGETTNLATSNIEKLEVLAQNLSDYLVSIEAQMPFNKITGIQVKWPIEAIKKM